MINQNYLSSIASSSARRIVVGKAETDDFFIKRLTSHHRLSAEEISCLSALQADIRQLRPHENFIQELAPNRYVYILRKGWGITYKLLPDGRRQVLSILLPGDIVPLYSGFASVAQYSAASLTGGEVAKLRAEDIDRAVAVFPRLGQAFNWCRGCDHHIFNEHILRLGRMSGYERTAHLLLELAERLSVVGLLSGNSFAMPLRQADLADSLGLSAVHMNRVLRKLQKDGMIRREDHQIELIDPEALIEIANYQLGPFDTDAFVAA